MSKPVVKEPPEARIAVHARPGAKRESLEWDEWRKTWVVSVRSPPVEGEANRAIESFLANALKVPRSAVLVTRGQTSREKTVTVQGLSPDEVERLLAAYRAAGPRLA
jgi:uncharacterized protein (TIGR00251 family)